ncbi:hP0423 family protein [Helicobacter pylori]|uniref:hypothetical protein n=1 Tax=Helicobacter pylori TaxID=210 RepID=UPI000957F1F8|nr:hypothetical protein [Helicobacter pylori]BAW73771.1 hP0423 family protein [Helicobacter pylori]BAW73774.1 hP0423 family protein [Helicobacter pylori]BAW74106.1 hP0423 family protein [Helicobacter pylori]BAW74107.1 hP0423 family protein [Helicobacter pylori]
MGFQNENQLKVGALVKATINDKVVEAKVISIGFNRVTLRSEKGNEVSYAFNSEKFLKWFNHVPLNEVAKNHAESGKKDILEGLKIVTIGPTIKERTTTPKEKEDRFKLAFGFRGVEEEGVSVSEVMISDYTLTERKSRLGVLLSPMLYSGNGSQISALIITALANAKGFNKHSDAEWFKMIEARNEDECEVDTFDNLDRVVLTLYCNVIKAYAEWREEFQNDFNDFSPSGFWAQVLPKNKNEALFVAQLLCDGGINKYGLSCAGLTAGLLADNLGYYGLSEAIEEVE